MVRGAELHVAFNEIAMDRFDHLVQDLTSTGVVEEDLFAFETREVFPCCLYAV